MHPFSGVFGPQVMPAMGATRHFGKGATKSMDLVLVISLTRQIAFSVADDTRLPSSDKAPIFPRYIYINGCLL